LPRLPRGWGNATSSPVFTLPTSQHAGGIICQPTRLAHQYHTT
jgi:hypothetical protein